MNDLTSEIIFLVIAICVYSIGVFLHAKIIIVSRTEKDMTWKLDITNSFLLIGHYTNIVFIHIVNFITNDFHIYIGRWFCYVSKAMVYYGVLYLTGHSLIVAIMKYVIIVHWQKVRDFGKSRIKELFFWLNFLHPIFMILDY